MNDPFYAPLIEKRAELLELTAAALRAHLRGEAIQSHDDGGTSGEQWSDHAAKDDEYLLNPYAHFRPKP